MIEIVTAKSLYKQIDTRVKYNLAYTTQAILSFYTSPFSIVGRMMNDIFVELIKQQFSTKSLEILESFFRNTFKTNMVLLRNNDENINLIKNSKRIVDDEFLSQYKDENLFLIKVSNNIAIPINKLHETGCFTEIKLDEEFNFEDINQKCILDVIDGEIKIYRLSDNEQYKNLILEIVVQICLEEDN